MTTGNNVWRHILPYGLTEEMLDFGLPVEDRRGRSGAVVSASTTPEGISAIVLADDGILWDVAAADVRFDLNKHLGLGAAILALGPVDCDPQWWHKACFRWFARDVDDYLRELTAQAHAEEKSAAVKRAYDEASPEGKAAIDRSWETVPGDIFGGASLPADWQEKDTDELLESVKEAEDKSSGA